MLAEYVNKLDIYYNFDNFVFQEGLRRLKPNFQLSNFGYTKKKTGLCRTNFNKGKLAKPKGFSKQRNILCPQTSLTRDFPAPSSSGLTFILEVIQYLNENRKFKCLIEHFLVIKVGRGRDQPNFFLWSIFEVFTYLQST